MMRWLISAPVWGERYVEEFCATTLPALSRAVGALIALNIDARVVIHTDSPDHVRGAAGVPVECRPVPAGARDFDCMSQAHREVLASGLIGDVVVLLTAGAVISEAGLVYCAETFENQRLKLIMCAVPRVLAEGQIPDPADTPSFMRWAWTMRHPITQDCTWPAGMSADLSRTYFVLGDDNRRDGKSVKYVATRQALPHPLAVRIDGRPLRFTPTVDANLMHCFDPSEMHLATSCDKLAMVKLTPRDKGHTQAAATMRARLENYELVIPNKHQQWCLGHRVMLLGAPQDCGDGDFVAKIMQVSGGRI